MTSDIAHELKTPLTGMRASTELLLDDEEMPDMMKQQFLNNMLQDSERLSRLINNILDFEKIGTGRATITSELKDISKTIAKTIAILTPNANKKEIQLLQINKNPIYLKYDEDRIVQVVTNLISNALKFCDPKKGRVEVDYNVKADWLIITVLDNGKGVPKEDQDFIFDKFYQSKNQNRIKPEGTGLGLAISKKIIESHQGEISLDKSFEKGAKFKIKIPLK